MAAPSMAVPRRPRFDWQLRSRLLPLGERTQLMAVLNVTPDSFSGDGLLERGVPAVVKAACRALDSGADLLDLGAESTRPKAQPIGAMEEQERLLPALEAVLRERPRAILSVDTYHAATAAAAAQAGAEIINDVSGLRWDEEMAKVAATTRCGLVLMHARGRPTEWSGLPALGDEAVLPYVFRGMAENLALAEIHGIESDAVVLDPGFAFGKLGEENITILAQLQLLHQLGRPLLVGLSRKGFLGALVHPLQPPELQGAAPEIARRNATLAANVAAVLAGAHIVRVHDVQATREAVAVGDSLLRHGWF